MVNDFVSRKGRVPSVSSSTVNCMDSTMVFRCARSLGPGPEVMLSLCHPPIYSRSVAGIGM